MKLTHELKERVSIELRMKLIAGGMSGDSRFQSQVEETVASRINYIERLLDEASDPADADELDLEDIADLEASIAVSEVSDPELAAAFEAARNGTLDVEEILYDINDSFETAFRHFCMEHGLKERTVERLLAYRQGYISTD